MKNHERWSIVMFIVIFLFAVFEFIYLPDGMGIRLLDGVRHYCRIKLPVLDQIGHCFWIIR